MHSTHGVPEVRRWTADTTGARFDFRNETMRLQIALESGTVRIYFTQEAFNNDAGAGAFANSGEEILELSSSSAFFDGPARVRGIWARGVGGDAVVTLIGYARV